MSKMIRNTMSAGLNLHLTSNKHTPFKYKKKRNQRPRLMQANTKTQPEMSTSPSSFSLFQYIVQISCNSQYNAQQNNINAEIPTRSQLINSMLKSDISIF